MQGFVMFMTHDAPVRGVLVGPFPSHAAAWLWIIGQDRDATQGWHFIALEPTAVEDVDQQGISWALGGAGDGD